MPNMPEGAPKTWLELQEAREEAGRRAFEAHLEEPEKTYAYADKRQEKLLREGANPLQPKGEGVPNVLGHVAVMPVEAATGSAVWAKGAPYLAAALKAAGPLVTPVPKAVVKYGGEALEAAKKAITGTSGKGKVAKEATEEVVETVASAGVRAVDEVADAAKQWQEKGVESPYFKRWFGNSSVVDDNGAPVVMYHGTGRSDMPQFETYGTPYGLMGTGTYFTASPSVASGYAETAAKKALKYGEEPSSNVLPVYLSIKNPLGMDAPADVARWIKAVEGIYDVEDAIEDLKRLGTEKGFRASNEVALRVIERAVSDAGLANWEGGEVIRTVIESMGHDGITHIGGTRRRVAPGAVRTKHRVYIAFEPEQIKSATGNRGTFDPKDPRIAYGAIPGAGVAAERAREDDE